MVSSRYHRLRTDSAAGSVRRLSAREAVSGLRRLGDVARWSVPEPGNTESDVASGSMGGARVYEDFLDLEVKPKFKLPSSARLFASGSCFARELELAFYQAGIPVLSWTPELDIENQFFHRYNTFSILGDFRGAFSGEFDERLAMETPAGWMDYTSYGPFRSKEELIASRRRIFDVHKNVRQADVLVVTLGLIEVWYDKATDAYLNIAPSEVLAANLSRYELCVTDYEDNVRALKSLIGEVRKWAGDQLKVVVTVSPVPLSATFSGFDVVQANTLSKSTLRAVAQEVADDDDGVDYFPSFESVMYSDPSAAWRSDRRHVRPEMVAHIVKTFSSAYLDRDGTEQHTRQAS